jgi:hypothetical protein
VPEIAGSNYEAQVKSFTRDFCLPFSCFSGLIGHGHRTPGLVGMGKGAAVPALLDKLSGGGKVNNSAVLDHSFLELHSLPSHKYCSLSSHSTNLFIPRKSVETLSSIIQVTY